MKSGLDHYDEAWFRQWFRNWAQRTNISRNPDDPTSHYDFRQAWKDRADPIWNEEFKKWEWQPQYRVEEEISPINININLSGIKQDIVDDSVSTG